MIEIVKNIMVPVAQAVVTTCAGIGTQMITEKIRIKNTTKRICKLSDDELENDELIGQISAGEIRKQKILNAVLISAEAVAIGVGAKLLSDAAIDPSSDDEYCDDDTTNTDDATDEAAFI